MAPATDEDELEGLGRRWITRLRNLRVHRIAFVHAGDDPQAQVLLWKSKDDPPPPSGATLAERLGLRDQAERREREMEETVRRAFDALARRYEKEVDGEMVKTLDRLGDRVTKAADLAGRLREMAERELDRRPVDQSGRPRTLEQALTEVTKTDQGRAVWRELRRQGPVEANQAFAKAFDHVAPEPAAPTQTGGEQTLRRLAREYQSTSARANELVTKEQALARVVDTDEGRAAYAAHRAEMASR